MVSNINSYADCIMDSIMTKVREIRDNIKKDIVKAALKSKSVYLVVCVDRDISSNYNTIKVDTYIHECDDLNHPHICGVVRGASHVMVVNVQDIKNNLDLICRGINISREELYK